MGLRGELVVDEAGLEALRPEWDALAVASRRPYCAPAWMLSWWRHASPEGALLRVAAAFDGERLVGIAPFWAQPRRARPARYRLLGSGVAEPLEPLAAAGFEDQAAAAWAAVLAGARPRPALLQLDRLTTASAWPERLRAGWPGRRGPGLWRTHQAPAPALSLEHDGLDDWLSTKSRNFRQQTGRSRRRLEATGAGFRLSSDEELVRDVQALARLHHARWEHRGGLGTLNEDVERMLVRAGRELIPEGRFRLWCLDSGGETVSAHLFVSAGGEVAYWLGGFDERFAKEHPGLVTLVVAIGDALERGDRRMDLGPGAADYKDRLSDSKETLEVVTLVPHGLREPIARGELAGRRAARLLLRR